MLTALGFSRLRLRTVTDNGMPNRGVITRRTDHLGLVASERLGLFPHVRLHDPLSENQSSTYGKFWQLLSPPAERD